MATQIQQHNSGFFSEIKTYESCLGKGGFGVVLKAIDNSNTTTAIKFIFLDRYKYSDREKLLGEYNVTEDLEHPNIVKVINMQNKAFSLTEIEEIFKDIPSLDEQRVQFLSKSKARHGKGLQTFCIQMELCGDNLRTWLNQYHDAFDLHVNIRQTRIIQGMISGLKYLHQNKIIHRDLKPENIMFSKGKHQLPIKIGDFGHSRKIETETESLTTGVGTRTYMAPEVHSGDYDHQADLFSLGLIMFEVSQLIEPKKRINFFDGLVTDQKEYLVGNHSIMKGIEEIIIGLTKRKPIERTKTLDDIQIDNWDQELLKEDPKVDWTPLWETILRSEKNLTVKTSEELKLCLDNAESGCIINLMDGEYLGPFVLMENDVQIVGNGSGTILKTREPDFRRKSCVDIVGSGCTISNVKITAKYSGITIHGSKNTIQEVQLIGTRNGIKIIGNQNRVDNVKIINAYESGIQINSDENMISNITTDDMFMGILVFGSKNNLTNLQLRGKNPIWKGSIGVQFVLNSSYNTISNLTCAGSSYNRVNDGWGLSSWEGSSNCTVEDSDCGPVWVRSGKNLTLKNVNCGELIQIEGCEGVELINCLGSTLKAPKTVIISPDCQFAEKKFIKIYE